MQELENNVSNEAISNEEYVLRTFDVCKRYKKQYALNGLSMNIKKGDIYGFVGENGSGKTTIIRVINGIIFAESGTYELFGVKSTDSAITKQRRRVGAVVETPSIYKNMSARDNIICHGEVVGVDARDKVDEILDSVGLSDVKNDSKKAGNFSLGMRQRLGIAMALVNDPEFLILDEPMNGLDPAGIVEVRNLILKLNQEKNITFLISSHILTELALVATKYGLISKGKIIKEITSEELNNELEKKTLIDVDDAQKAKASASKVVDESLVSYTSTGIAIKGEVELNDIIVALVKDEIKILNVNTSSTTIEDYYLETIVKGGNK